MLLGIQQNKELQAEGWVHHFEIVWHIGHGGKCGVLSFLTKVTNMNNTGFEMTKQTLCFLILPREENHPLVISTDWGYGAAIWYPDNIQNYKLWAVQLRTFRTMISAPTGPAPVGRESEWPLIEFVEILPCWKGEDTYIICHITSITKLSRILHRPGKGKRGLLDLGRVRRRKLSRSKIPPLK